MKLNISQRSSLSKNESVFYESVWPDYCHFHGWRYERLHYQQYHVL